MPKGTEQEPGPYALEVAAALANIAKKRGLSNRALAAAMSVGEKYIRDRIKKDAVVSFTVSDVERFSEIVEISPEDLLNDPSRIAAEHAFPPVSEVRAIVTNIGGKQADAAVDFEKVDKKAALRNAEMDIDEAD